MDSSEKKSFKVTNSQQFQTLVGLMQENVQLAKCVPASGRAKLYAEQAWDDVAQKINTYGPPERTGSEWKKIWADLKCRTKKKILENNKNVSACGEGSCRMLYLSELEQSVDKILDFSTMIASQPVCESPNDDFSFEADFSDVLKPGDVKTEQDDTTPSIQISKNSKTFINKKSKQSAQTRLLEKRKYENTERQLKLLQQQIKAQEKILDVMQAQASATKTISEAASRQADAISVIAESTQSIALAMNDAVKYLKSD